MRTQKIQVEAATDFRLYGLVTSVRPHRLTLLLNRALELDLSRRDTSTIQAAHGGAVYHFDDELNRCQYYLVANKSEEGCLLPERKGANYLLKVEGHCSNAQAHELLQQLRRLDVMELAFEIVPGELKSTHKLMFE